MFLPALAFILAMAVILGSYYVITFLPDKMASRRLDQRLQEVSAAAFGPESKDLEQTVVKQAMEGALPGMDRMMEGTRAGSWLARLIQQAGVKTTPSSVILKCVGLGVVFGGLTYLIARQAWAAPLAVFLTVPSPILWLMHRRGVRVRKFEEQFPEALDLLSRAIRAGHAFQTAMGMVADELEDPVGPEFKTTFDQQNYGLPLREALNQMPERIPLLDVRFFVTAVLIQRDTGGNLSEILDNLAHVVRERFKIHRQIRVHTAHGRVTGYVLLALPACLGMALSIMNPEHMEPLFKERLGQMMLIGAMIMQAVGYVWIRKVIKIEV